MRMLIWGMLVALFALAVTYGLIWIGRAIEANKRRKENAPLYKFEDTPPPPGPYDPMP